MHPFDCGKLIAAAWPQQHNDHVTPMSLKRSFEVVDNVLHGGEAEWVEEVENHLAVRKDEVLRISMQRSNLPAASLPMIRRTPRIPRPEAADIRASLLMEKTGKFDTGNLLERQLGRDKQGAALAGAEVDVAELGYVVYRHVLQGLPNVGGPGRLIKLAVLEVFRNNAGRL